MTQKFAHLAAALACAALSSPAFATASASASLSEFSLSLVDLQNDFYPASFEWIADGEGAHPEVVVSVADDGSHTGEYHVGFAKLLDPVSTVANFGAGLAHARAAFSGDGSLENFGVAVSGNAMSGTADAKNEFHAGAGVDYGIHWPLGNFVLGPQTEVTFSALSFVSVFAGGSTPDYADAEASLGIDYGDQNYMDRLDACSEPSNPEGSPMSCSNVGHSLTLSQLLTVSLSNPTNSPIIGRFSAGASVNGFSMASAVPEPASYSLFASGLALVGMMLRRRRRSADSPSLSA